MKYKGVIFDLDGTLVDTLADLANAMNYGLEVLGEPTHSIDECRKMIGNGVSKFAERALSSDKQHLHGELLKLMKQRYLDNCFENSTLYDGIDETFDYLKEAGIQLGVVTKKDAGAARQIVEHFFGKGTFTAIVGVKDGKYLKPGPEGTLEIIKKMKLDKKQILLAGDSDVDIITAINAGVTAAGVSWGFRSRDELIEAGAKKIINHPSEIIELVT